MYYASSNKQNTPRPHSVENTEARDGLSCAEVRTHLTRILWKVSRGGSRNSHTGGANWQGGDTNLLFVGSFPEKFRYWTKRGGADPC